MCGNYCRAVQTSSISRSSSNLCDENMERRTSPPPCLDYALLLLAARVAPSYTNYYFRSTERCRGTSVSNLLLPAATFPAPTTTCLLSRRWKKKTPRRAWLSNFPSRMKARVDILESKSRETSNQNGVSVVLKVCSASRCPQRPPQHPRVPPPTRAPPNVVDNNGFVPRRQRFFPACSRQPSRRGGRRPATLTW